MPRPKRRSAPLRADMCEWSHRVERRLFPPLVLLFTLLLAASTLYSLRLTPRHPPPPLLVPAYVTLVALVVLTYLRTHLTAPGGAAHWRAQRPDLLYPGAAPHAPADVEQPSPTCAVCDTVKFARVHHCSVCRTCVLRYDHHCVWLANCVGLFNAKFFLQFLLYTFFATLSTAVLHVRLLMYAPSKLDSTTVLFVAIVSPVSLSSSLVTCGAVCMLFVWNLWLAANNRTALEHLLLSQRKAVVCYNASLLHNLRHLLGWNPLLWPVPVAQSRGPPPKTKN